MSTDLARQHTGLLNVETGEILPATVESAAAVLIAARNMKQRVNDVVAETTVYLADEAARRGTKTLNGGGEKIVLTGGLTEEYDVQDLIVFLRNAGCPEDRLDQAIVTEITYRVNKSVIRQLAAANPEYKAAIELAKRLVEKPVRANVKARRAA